MEAREGRAADLHVKALGMFGLGRRAEARAALASALEADPDDVSAAVLRRSARRRGLRGGSHPKPRAPVEAPPQAPRGSSAMTTTILGMTSHGNEGTDGSPAT